MELSKSCCAVEGCRSLVKARGLCFRHYNEARANGRTCSVDGCRNAPHARGLCSVHYYRWHKTGDPGEAELRRQPIRLCQVVDCDNPATASRYLCPTHHRRKRLYGSADLVFANSATCVICGGRAVAGDRSSEYCREHYLPHVKVLIVEGKLKGTKSPAGYVYHSVLKDRLAEHRVVMEHMLGRALVAGETPHHRNGRRDDNRPANLELWVKPQPAGQRPEDLVAWVVEHYPQLVRDALDRR